MTHRNSPSEVTVRRLLEIFQQTGSVNDVKTEIRVRFSRFTGKVVAVRPNVEENPTTLIWHRAQEINFPEKLFYSVFTEIMPNQILLSRIIFYYIINDF